MAPVRGAVAQVLPCPVASARSNPPVVPPAHLLCILCPDCAKNNKKIGLGLFLEQTCSYPGPGGLHEALHYVDSLPYVKKFVVDTKCIP